MTNFSSNIDHIAKLDNSFAMSLALAVNNVVLKAGSTYDVSTTTSMYNRTTNITEYKTVTGTLSTTTIDTYLTSIKTQLESSYPVTVSHSTSASVNAVATFNTINVGLIVGTSGYYVRSMEMNISLDGAQQYNIDATLISPIELTPNILTLTPETLLSLNTVSESITNVNNVATTIVPNIAEILLASTNAATATANANAAADSYDAFDDRYLGSKASNPLLDNDGNTLLVGALYWNSIASSMYAWNGTTWVALPSSVAASIANIPAGNITSTTVQSALNELDTKHGGRRNYLINGNFDKWDYASSQTLSGYGSDNRWQNNNSGSAKTNSQQVCGDTERALFNAMYYSRTVVSSVVGSNNYTNKFQFIENVNLLAGKTVTLSFWAKADANKNIAIEFYQKFGTGGNQSADVSGISAQLVALTTTWQKKTITVTLPSIVGKAIGTDGVQTTSTALLFWFDAGSTYTSRTASLGQQSGTFDIAQVRIEDGSVATNGWHPYDGEFGGETAACARYYEVQDMKIWTDTINGSLYGYRTMFAVKKRSIPTITQLAFTGSNFSSMSIENPSLISVGTYSQATSTASSQSWVYTFSASAEL
jgi:hypothetical protein